jgi:hypothetical protein
VKETYYVLSLKLKPWNAVISSLKEELMPILSACLPCHSSVTLEVGLYLGVRREEECWRKEAWLPALQFLSCLGCRDRAFLEAEQ